MDPKFQPSFIPKKTETPLTMGQRPHGGNGILYSVGVILFTVAVIGSIGAFAYEKYLGGRISKMKVSLEEARAALDPELIAELSRSQARIESAKELLSRHVALTTLFSLLESLTLQSVRYTNFSYSSLGDRGILVSLLGEARDYKSVALQSEILSQNPYVKDPGFSNLDLNEDGNVTFEFKAHIAPDFLLYEKAFESAMIPIESPPTGPAQDTSAQTNPEGP
jgi:hypothetical protein